MYTGTLIDDLMATVERTEKHAPPRSFAGRKTGVLLQRSRSRNWRSSNRIWLGWHKWQQQRQRQGAAHGSRRKPCWTGTPEIYFAKAIDNSRLVKVEDPQRSREMRQFGIALGCLFLLVMTYTWQHFKAIEYGYKIESMKNERDGLLEMNRALRLEEASLRSPERIDRLARQYGMQPPQAGQVIRMDSAPPDAGAPVMASASVSVISVP